MKKVQNIVAVTGEYEKDGVTKKKYATIGKLFTKEDGKQNVLIELRPTKWDGRAFVADIERNETRKHDDDHGDLPF